MQLQPDVIVIGAGPIGLFTAIQIKLYHPQLEILLYEKYREYQRRHAIFVSKNSFKNSHPDEKFQELIKPITGTIRTNNLEHLFKTFALGLDIKIEYQHVKNIKDLLSKHPSCKYLIGADGSHSSIHDQIFHGQYQLKYNFRSIMEVKYDVVGLGKKLNLCSSLGLGSQHLVHQFIGKPKEESKTSPVVLRFLITPKEYEAMKDASFKNPWNIQDKRIPRQVSDSISAWLSARKKSLGEEIVPDSIRVGVITLPTYASSVFFKKNEDITTFLVGDAACGVPYFRSINNGLFCASALAKNLTSPEMYNDFVQSRVRRELLGAKVKDKIITSLDYSHSSIVKTADLVRSSKEQVDSDYDLHESATSALFPALLSCNIL